MSNDMENNRRVCQMEKEAREKRLLLYAEAIQKSTLEETSQIMKELVEERHRLGMTQQDIDHSGVRPQCGQFTVNLREGVSV